jgi:hypothetical protein
MSAALLSSQSSGEQGTQVVDLATYRAPDAGQQKAFQYPLNAASATPSAKPFVEAAVRENGSINMDDKDVQRLEDRISTSEDRSQLRLEIVVGQIDGKFGRVEAGLEHVATAISTLTSEVRDSRRHSLAMWLTVLIAVIGIGVAVWQGVINSQTAIVTSIQTGVAIQQGAQSQAVSPRPSQVPPPPIAEPPSTPGKK